MAKRTGTDPARLKRSSDYLLLHAGMIDRWNVLDELGDYPNMLTPLSIQ
jgi:hypothetical protein